MEKTFADPLQQTSLQGGESGLYHPYQGPRSLPDVNNWDMRQVGFSTLAFNSRAEVQIPSMPLTCHSMFLEMEVAGEGADVGASVQPCATWLTLQQGAAQLLYKEYAIYEASQAEILMSDILDQEPYKLAEDYQALGFGQAAGDANSAQVLYMNLAPLAKVLGLCGPIAAYPSNSFSVSIDLRAVGYCTASANTGISNVSISNARLIILGSKSSSAEVSLAREALSSGAGINFNFLRSQSVSQTLADNNGSATTYTASYTGVEGAVSRIRLLIRNNSLLNVGSANTQNSVSWQVFSTKDDKINVGTSSDPYKLGGQAYTQKWFRTFQQAMSSRSAGKFIANPATVAQVNTGIFDISLCESEADLLYGTSSGSMQWKNDGQVQLLMTTDTVQDDRLDSVIYVHAACHIDLARANIVNSA